MMLNFGIPKSYGGNFPAPNWLKPPSNSNDFLKKYQKHRKYEYNVGPPFTIAKLVNITPITMVYYTQLTIEFMGLINQLISRGAPHCRE